MLRPRHFLHPAMSLQNTINIAYCGSSTDFCIQCLADFFNCCDMAFFRFSLTFLKNIFFLLIAEFPVVTGIFHSCKLFEALCLKLLYYFRDVHPIHVQFLCYFFGCFPFVSQFYHLEPTRYSLILRSSPCLYDCCIFFSGYLVFLHFHHHLYYNTSVQVLKEKQYQVS